MTRHIVKSKLIPYTHGSYLELNAIEVEEDSGAPHAAPWTTTTRPQAHELIETMKDDDPSIDDCLRASRDASTSVQAPVLSSSLL